MAGETLLNLFVSSPGDVQKERERVDFIVERLNAEYAGRVQIRAIRWETRYYSSHDTFQSQIPEARDCDLVLAVFGARLGSPLPEAFPHMPSGEPYPSGTAYEVLSAMEARRAGRGVPDIYVFRRPSAPLVALDAADRADIEAQWTRLTGFFETWFRNRGGQFLAAFQEFATTDEFAAKAEDCLRQWLDRRGFPARSAMWDRARLGSPYPGLAAFDETRRSVFFGRTTVVEQAIQRLRDLEAPKTEAARAPFLLLIGASGSGKSSLLRAGLLPRVGMPGVLPEVDLWRRAVAIPGADPFLSLAEALFAPDALGAELSRGAFRNREILAKQLAADADVALAPLRDALDAAAAARQRQGNFETPRPARLFLALDQAERLLIETPSELRLPFAKLLEALCRQRLASVVVALRSDAYARFQSLEPFTRLREAGATLDLMPATASELEEMATRPAALCDPPLRFETREGRPLSTLLVEDARGGDALPLLQMTLARLSAAEAARGDGVLRFRDYVGLGEAVSQTAREALAGLDETARAQLPQLVTGLVRDISADPLTGEPTPTIGALDRARFESGRPERTALIEAFVAKRLLTSEGDGASQRVRPTHESLLRIWPEAVEIIGEAAHLIRAREAVAPLARAWFEASDADKARHLDVSPALLEGAKLFVERFGDEVPTATRDFVAAAGAAADAKLQHEKQLQERRLADARAIAAANRRIAQSTGIGLVAALALAAVAGAQWWSATQARQSAEIARQTAQVQRDRAERALGAATKTADALIFDLAKRFRLLSGVPKSVVKDILDQALSLQDQLMGSGENNMALAADHAAALHELALTRFALGDNGDALDMARKAREALVEIVARAPGDADHVHRLVEANETMGDIEATQGDRTSAGSSYADAMAAIDAGLANAVSGPQIQRDRGRVLGKMSIIARQGHDIERAIQLAREGLAILTALGEPKTSDYGARSELAIAHRNLGDALLSADDINGATSAFETAAAISGALAKETPDNTLYLRDNTLSEERLAEALTAKGDLQGALKAYSAGEATASAMATHDPDNLGWQFDIAIGHREIGDTQLALGDTAGAIQSYRQAIEIDRPLVARSGANDAWNGHYWTMLFALGGALSQTGHDAAESLATFREALAWAQSHANVVTPDDMWLMRLGRSRQAVGDGLLAHGDLDSAIASYRDAASGLTELMSRQPTNEPAKMQFWVLQTRIGDALTRRGGEDAAALAAYREAMNFARRLADSARPGEDWLLSYAASSLKVGNILSAAQDADGALAIYRASLDVMRARASAPNASVALRTLAFQTQAQLAGALALKSDAAGALAAYADAERGIREVLAQTPGATDARGELAVVLVSAAHLHMSAKAPEKAIPALREAINLAQGAIDEQPSQSLWVHELAVAHDSLGQALNAAGDWRGAIAQYRLKLEAGKRLPASEAPAWRLDDALTWEILGGLLTAHGDGDGALEALRQAGSLRKALADESPQDAQARRAELVDANAAGNLLAQLGKPQEAASLFKDNVAIARALAGRPGAEAQAASDLAITLSDLGEAQASLSDAASAMASFTAAADAMRGVVASGGSDPSARARLAATLRRLGELRSAAGDGAAALSALREARALLEPLMDESPSAPRRDLSLIDNAIGATLLKGADGAGAAQAFADSAGVIEAGLKLHADDIALLDDLAFTRRALGDALEAKGDTQGALDAFRASIAAADALLALKPDAQRGARFIIVAGDRMGNLLLKGGDAAGALKAFARARDEAAAVAAQAPADANARASLKLAVDKIGFVANAQLIKGDFEGALTTLVQAAPRAPEQNWLDLIRAEALMFLDRPDEARPLLLAHRGETSFAGKVWEALVLESFRNTRARGMTRPLMQEIEKTFAPAP